tara:strand:+ start:440 stop:598 length:159 start_codon:yes stop_codon:yes gene_type:complete
MWKLVLKKEFGDVVVQNFRTKKEAEDELQNRTELIRHLTRKSASGVYKIQKG